MAFFDTVYRIFMFLLPGAVCIAAYVWMGKKALRTPQKTARIIALGIIGAGLVFTLYRLVLSVHSVFTNDVFEFIIIIVAIAVLALASIVMAIGEPEDLNKKVEEKGLMKVDGEDEGLKP